MWANHRYRYLLDRNPDIPAPRDTPTLLANLPDRTCLFT